MKQLRLLAFVLIACGGSPRGFRVVFDSSLKPDRTDALNLNGTYNIWRVNTDGTGLTPLTNATASSANSFGPQWSPDGSKLVFDSSRRLDGTDALNVNGTYNIWRANADGTGLTPLTNAIAAGADSTAAQWSPDNSKIVFTSTRNLDGTDAPSVNLTKNIWRANADGTGLTPLTNAIANGAGGWMPQWSPDGSKIIFSSSRRLDGTDAPNAAFNIWRMSANGTGLTPLTNATAYQADSVAPQWSPDGSKIVFMSSRSPDGTDAMNAYRTYNIWRVSADGTGLVPLTRATASGADSLEPQWSPDGSKIVFASSRKLDGTDAMNANFTYNIWRMSADGTGLVPLTTATANGADSLEPQWSPDGSKIVFNSSRKLDGTDASTPTYNIWRVNADGTGLTPLTKATASGVDSNSPRLSR